MLGSFVCQGMYVLLAVYSLKLWRICLPVSSSFVGSGRSSLAACKSVSVKSKAG